MNVVFLDEQDDPLEPGPLVALATAVLEKERLPVDTEMSLRLVDENTISEHNLEYLGREGPTDVLSFPIEDLVPGQEHPDMGGPPLLIGDVLICPSVVRRKAAAAQVRFEDELALIVVHGILHLLGYDHADDADAELMEERERVLLANMGVHRP